LRFSNKREAIRDFEPENMKTLLLSFTMTAFLCFVAGCATDKSAANSAPPDRNFDQGRQTSIPQTTAGAANTNMIERANMDPTR